MRIGHGYDVHAFGENRRLILGGVEVPYERGLLAHSDGDVLLHALMDAILGAAALGDIGQMFPDTDPQYKNADSGELLRLVYLRVTTLGYSLENLDCTIIAQAPRLSGFIPQMVKNIADILQISPSRVNVKATTEEHLGFTGRGEGIAAHAVVLLNN
ncbi:MAG: 2-C-methyl-D-erythritol 2,4-cyclodiphosphate synthase [Oscillospiraceae bacterium]